MLEQDFWRTFTASPKKRIAKITALIETTQQLLFANIGLETNATLEYTESCIVIREKFDELLKNNKNLYKIRNTEQGYKYVFNTVVRMFNEFIQKYINHSRSVISKVIRYLEPSFCHETGIPRVGNKAECKLSKEDQIIISKQTTKAVKKIKTNLRKENKVNNNSIRIYKCSEDNPPSVIFVDKLKIDLNKLNKINN
jgi:hypothetical protein